MEKKYCGKTLMTLPPFYNCWHFDSDEKVEFVENLTEVTNESHDALLLFFDPLSL